MMNEKMQKIMEKAKRNNITVDVLDEVKEKKESSYWYSGNLVELTDNVTNKTYIIVANGDVLAKLYETEEGSESAYVNDKSNSEQFESEMSRYINSDDELNTYIKNFQDAQNGDRVKTPYLEIGAGNWFELFEGSLDDTDPVVLNDIYYTDAIDEAVEQIISYRNKQPRATLTANPTFNEAKKLMYIITQSVNGTNVLNKPLTYPQLATIATTYQTGLNVYREVSNMLALDDDLMLSDKEIEDLVNTVVAQLTDDPDEHKAIAYLINENLQALPSK